MLPGLGDNLLGDKPLPTGLGPLLFLVSVLRPWGPLLTPLVGRLLLTMMLYMCEWRFPVTGPWACGPCVDTLRLLGSTQFPCLSLRNEWTMACL